MSLQISPLSPTPETTSGNKIQTETEVGTETTRISSSATTTTATTISRRQWFTTTSSSTIAFAAAVTKSFGIMLPLQLLPPGGVLVANAEPSFIPIQDAIAPGHWLGQFAIYNFNLIEIQIYLPMAESI